jgi:hypothetical protein
MDQRTSEIASAVIGHPAAEDVAPGHIEYVQRLSLHEQFRLIEIAAETRSEELRTAALKVLRSYLNPLVTLAPTPRKD